jgi:bleomycin hydrolase
LNSEMISLYRMAKTTHSMLLFDMASGECGKWWRAQNNIENYETHNENFFISDSWLKKYVFIAVLNKKNINMDVFKHVFLEPWKIL